jgi:hypothetical protein
MVERAALNRLVLVQVQVPQLGAFMSKAQSVQQAVFPDRGAACFVLETEQPRQVIQDTSSVCG